MNNSPTSAPIGAPLATQVDLLFQIAHDEAPEIESVLRAMTEEQGGWSPEKWEDKTGGTLLVMDAEGRVVRTEMVMQPSPEWREATEGYALAKARAVIGSEEGSPSIELIDDDAGIWAGGIPFSYTCPYDGSVKIGAIAFSGWPQNADHLSVSLWGTASNLTIDMAHMMNACPYNLLKEELLADFHVADASA